MKYFDTHKASILTIFLIFLVLTLTAQPYHIHVHSGTTGHEFIARDYVRIYDGYSCTPNSNSFLFKVDEELCVYDDYSYNDPPSAQNRQIDLTSKVGSIPGVAGVSENGAATYSIKLPLPNGINGLKPEILLEYNSQSGTGILGQGWNIIGLSSIQRVPKNNFLDAYIDGVKFDNTDRFALNGTRLVKKSGTGNYGDNETIYHTELESFMQVTCYANSNGPQYFSAISKDGKTIEFGNSNSSNIKPNQSNLTYCWLINKIEDVYDNVIEYSYIQGEQANNFNFYPSNNYATYYIDEINYAGNSYLGINPKIKIKFLYSFKHDIENIAIGNAFHEGSKLLRKIRVSIDEKTWREYKFTYQAMDDNMNCEITQLVEMKEYTSNDSLNATIFEWGNLDDIFTNSGITYTPLNYDSNDEIYIDLDNDGKSEYFYFLNWANTCVVDKFTQNGTSPFFLHQLPVTISEIKQIIPGNFNGDNYTDLLLIHETTTTIETSFLISNGVSFDDYLFVHSSLKTWEPRFEVEDFDGDAKSDLIIAYNSYYGSPNIHFYPSNGIHPVNSWPGCGYDLAFDSVYCGDFNGNGRRDMLFVKSDGVTGVKIIELNNANTSLIEYPFSLTFTNSDYLFTGDFNGDGRTDLLAKLDNYTDWVTYYNTGDDFSEASAPISNQNYPSPNPYDDNYIIVDLDGDGKDEIIEVLLDQNNNHIKKVFNHNGSKWIKKSKEYQGIYGSIYSDRYADVNGDSKVDLIVPSETNPSDRIVLYSYYEDERNRIKYVSDGFGHLTHFKYSYLPLYSGYTKSNNAQYPLGNINSGINIVTSMFVDNGNGGMNEIAYFYKNAIIHKQGRGFLGFMETSSRNTATTILATRYFSINSNKYIKHLDRISSSINGSNTLIQETIIDYELIDFYTDFGTESFIFVPKTIEEYNFETAGNSPKTTINTYGDFGNLEETEATTGNWIESTTFSNFCSSGSWYPCKSEDISKSLQEFPFNEHITTFTIDYEEGRVKEKVVNMDGADFDLKEEYTYNSFGLIGNRKTTSDDNKVNEKLFEYSNDGRFLEKEASIHPDYPSNQYETEYEHNIYTNLLEKSIDVNGLETEYEYNDFGRLVKTILPTGIETTNSLEWCDSNDPENSLYKSVTKVGSYPQEVVFYDKLGREICAEYTNHDNDVVRVNKEYNNLGQLYRESLPYYSSSQNQKWTTYTYDYLGRVSTVVQDDGATIIYAYQFNVSNNCYIKTKVITPLSYGTSFTTESYDIAGRLIQTQDQIGNEVNFSYNSQGLTKSISVNPVSGSSNTVNLEYDHFGNRILIDDPDAGEITSTYNSFGELKTKESATGAFSYTYDSFGRILTESGTSTVSNNLIQFTHSFTYDQQSNALGTLSSINRLDENGASSEIYSYDNVGRLESKVIEISGNSYDYSYTYDDYGNIISEFLPGNVEYNYSYQNGYIDGIDVTNDGTTTTVWTCNNVNQFGSITNATLGSGLISIKSYSDMGILENLHWHAGYDILKYEYEFNSVSGNLDNRSETTSGGFETFYYDDLNRITEAGNVNYEYSPKGNIELITNVGEFQYNSSQPHAISDAILSNPDAIPSLTQEVQYNCMHNPISIEEGDYSLDFIYGPYHGRTESKLYQNSQLVKNKIYLDDLEISEESGSIKQVYYISVYGQLIGVLIKESNQDDKIYYTHTDHLGSICKITDGDDWQNVIAEYSYDAYGRMRNPDDWEDYAVNQELLFDRGYTGHEHLQEFGIIHMNGRLYDPVLGRFFSPDNNIQAPTNSQNFNRYSYCLNNPLIYTDPSGECFAPVYFFATMFVADAMSNIINGYDDPLRLAWNNSTTTFNGMNNCLQLPIYQNEHTTINIGISPMTLGVNASIKNRIGDMERSASIEYGMSGLFASGGVSYSNKKTSLGVGFGYGNNHWAWGVNGKVDGFGGGYYQTFYGDAISNISGTSNPQSVGGANIFLNDVSIRLENDFLMFNEQDRWRSNGVELSYKNLSIGTYLYNNDPKNTYGANAYSLDKASPIWGLNRDGKDGISYGGWDKGYTYTSPLYLGFRYGNTIYRTGYSHHVFQDFTQNGIHKYFLYGRQHYYQNYSKFKYGMYYYQGCYNPYSLWGR